MWAHSTPETPPAGDFFLQAQGSLALKSTWQAELRMVERVGALHSPEDSWRPKWGYIAQSKGPDTGGVTVLRTVTATDSQ